MKVILDHPYAGAGRMYQPGEGVDVSEEQALRMIDAGTAHRPGEEASIQETAPEAEETRTDQRPQGFGRRNPPAEKWWELDGVRYRIIQEKDNCFWVTDDASIPVGAPFMEKDRKPLKKVSKTDWAAGARVVSE